MKFFFHLLLFLVLVSPLRAQQEIDYTDGEINTTAISTTAPRDPTTLNIATGAATQGGAITGTGGIIITGNGALSFTNGANTYSGGTTVNSGALVRADFTESFGSTSGNLTVNGGTVDLNGAALLVGSLSGDGGTVLDNLNSSTVFLSVGTGNGSGSYSGVIADNAGSGLISVLSLTKTGTGTQTLAGANTYTGGTQINAGTLDVTGTIATPRTGLSLSVNGGGTLAGTGTINDLVQTASTSHVAPGSTSGTVGTLHFGNPGFTVGSGTSFDYDLNTSTAAGGTSNDLIAMTGGTLTFGGTATFNINALSTLSTAGSYTLISGATSVSGFNASNFSTLGLGSGLTATYSLVGTSLKLSIGGNPSQAYFNGNTSSDLNTASNFYTTASGNTAIEAPIGSTTDVVVTANTGGSSVGMPTLNTSNLTINSLTLTGTGTPGAIGIDLYGSKSLTINATTTTGSGGLNTASNGITAQAGAGNDVIGVAIVLGNSQTWTVASTNALTVIGTISGSGKTLTKAGSGTLQLGGNNTYTGGTVISSGTLMVVNSAGSATGSGPLTLNNSATLVGTGTINSTTNSINGNVLVGPGDLTTLGNLTLTSSGTTTFSGASLTFNLNAASVGQGNELNVGSSSVLFSGAVTNLILNLFNSETNAIANNSDYILFAGTSSNQYSGLTVDPTTGAISGLNFTLTGTGTDGQPNSTDYSRSFLFMDNGDIDVRIVTESVPEPQTQMLLFGGMVLLGFWSRRKFLRPESTR